MKREIICKECEIEKRQLFPTESPYSGEHVKFVNGKALAEFSCDNCWKTIPIGEETCAMSIWADYGGISYYSWEEEYLILSK